MKNNSDWPDDAFQQFWSWFPRRIARKAAQRAFEKVKVSGVVTFEKLLQGVLAYAGAVRGKDVQYICHPATWLNGERWTDEIAAIAGKPERRTTADIGRALLEKLRAADSVADDARGSGEGCYPDDERLH